MSGETVALEARLRQSLREEVAEIALPAALWPRLEARISRPIESSPTSALVPEVTRELTRTVMPRILTLALLGEQPMDSFTLARRVEDSARRAGCTTPGEATLLPLLHQLEREGLVHGHWRQGRQGLRRVYGLRGRGRRVWNLAVVRCWLPSLIRRLRPVTQDPIQRSHPSGG